MLNLQNTLTSNDQELIQSVITLPSSSTSKGKGMHCVTHMKKKYDKKKAAFS